MKNKILDTINRHGMLARTDRLLVALSGGPDSVCLLHCMCTLREDRGLQVRALHFNHMLRGAESDRDEEFVRDLCERWMVPLTVASADVAALSRETGRSIELCARQARYEALERHAEEGEVVATGHNRDDNAETVILNLIRGTALRGLSGIPPVRGIFIRPLLGCSRKEIEAYCGANGLDYVTDSTNASPHYTRNRIRHTIIPLLEGENPRFLERAATMADGLRADADFLDHLADKERERMTSPRGVERIAFLACEGVLQSRILARMVAEAGLSPDRDTIERLWQIVLAGQGVQQLAKDIEFVCDEEWFSIRPITKSAPFFSAQFTKDECFFLGIVSVYSGKNLRFTNNNVQNIPQKQKNQKKGLTYCLDYDKIKGIVTLRQKMSGDKIRLPGRGHTKTLKNLFQENKVSVAERSRRVVVADDEGVLLVEGIGVSERACITEQTKHILTIEILEEP